jgi:hypothetical protein
LLAILFEYFQKKHIPDLPSSVSGWAYFESALHLPVLRTLAWGIPDWPVSYKLRQALVVVHSALGIAQLPLQAIGHSLQLYSLRDS